MHISEGILSPPVLAAGAVLAVGGTALGLRGLDHEDVPKVGLLSAVLFIASLVHVPIGVSSAHLVLNGLAGVLLGWSLFPALLVALALQALLFQFGGLTTLGVNTFNLAFPGVICGLLFRHAAAKGRDISDVRASLSAGFAAAFVGLSFLGAVLCGKALLHGFEEQVVPWSALGLATAVILIVGMAAGPRLKSVLPPFVGFACGAAAVFLSGALVAVSLYLSGEGFVKPAQLIVVGHLPIMIIEGIVSALCIVFLRKVKPSLLQAEKQVITTPCPTDS